MDSCPIFLEPFVGAMNIWCSGHTFLALEFQISTNSILWTHQNNGTFIDGNVKQISCCIHDGSERRRSFLHPYVRTWERSATNALVHSFCLAPLWAVFHDVFLYFLRGILVLRIRVQKNK